MKMNRIILLILLGITTNLFAQNYKQQERAEREAIIEEARIAFITKELNLSSEKSQRFWPVYNAYASERKEIMKDMRKMRRKTKQVEKITDSEALTLINKRLENEEKMLNLNKSYKDKFLKVLSPTEFLKLHKAEKKFLHWLREKSDLKEKQGQHGPPGEY